MFLKLLKYDFRANLKIYLFVWPAIIVLAGLDRLLVSVKYNGVGAPILAGITTTLFVLSIIGACVFAFVIAIVRFYNGLLNREGYLMFSLPVKPWQLVLSKLLTGLATLLATIAVSIGGCMLLFSGMDGLTEALREVFGYFIPPDSWTVTLMILFFVVSLAVSILQVYIACCIGHLFKKHRILLSVAFYYAIKIVLDTLSTLFSGWFFAVANRNPQMFVGQTNTAFILTIVLNLALGCIFFFVSEHILRKHLNLE